MSRSPAIVITAFRVMPERLLPSIGGVRRAPSITAKRFWPLPSLIWPSWVSAIASTKPLAIASSLMSCALL